MSTHLPPPSDDEIERMAEPRIRAALWWTGGIVAALIIALTVLLFLLNPDVIGILQVLTGVIPISSGVVWFLHNERKKKAIRTIRQEYQNKAFPQPREVIDVKVEKRPESLPPPPIHPSTMPPSDLFVGRKKLLADIWKRLRNADERNLLTLWGIGGVGKSAVALKIINDDDAKTLFPDGQYWLDLRGGDAAVAIRGLLVREFDMGNVQLPNALNEVVALFHRAVRGRQVLLVMDNAESLATSPAEIRKIVRQIVLPTPGMTIVTSRVEIERPHDIEVKILEAADGVELLEKGLNWNKAEREREKQDALKLVTHLEGLALALRITMSRMSRRKQSCAVALAELQKAPMLDIAAAEGEKTVGQTFALSYKDLQEPFRTLFHFLGVCAVGGARVAALTEMLGWSEGEVEETIDGLVERSLAERTATRVELHPLLHQFAAECAREEKSAYQEWVRKHVAYYGYKIGGSYQDAMNNDRDILPVLQATDISIENVRLAQIRSLEETFTDKRLAVISSSGMKRFWQLRNEPKLYEWLIKTGNLAEQTGQKIEQANVLQAIGDVQAFRDDREGALASYGEALTLFKAVGSSLGQANVLQAIGDVQAFRDDRDSALASYGEALTLFKAVGDRLGQANVQKAIGDVQAFRKENDSALASYGEALTLFKAVGSSVGQANVQKAIGDVQAFRDDRDSALASYGEALTLFKAVGSSLGQANVLQAIGDVQAFRKENEGALASYGEALTLFKAVGSSLGQANTLAAQSRILLIEGRQAESDVQLKQAVDIYLLIGDLYSVAAQTANHGWALQRNGKLEEAKIYFGRAAELFSKTNLTDRVEKYRKLAE